MKNVHVRYLELRLTFAQVVRHLLQEAFLWKDDHLQTSLPDPELRYVKSRTVSQIEELTVFGLSSAETSGPKDSNLCICHLMRGREGRYCTSPATQDSQ